MPSPRGRSHTTLTETAKEVVSVLEKYAGIKMIAPGMITGRNNTAKRHVTAVYTTAGMELIISGQGVQKVAVHTVVSARTIFSQIKTSKKLQHFTWSSRERKPGV
jgi:Predicted metal-binding protein (DUF2103)